MPYEYSLLGLFVGVLVGLTGMGGGSLMTPLLILLLHQKASIAVGTDLAYSSIMKIAGSWQHRQTGDFDKPLAMRLAMGSVPASLVGVYVSHMLQKKYGELAEKDLTHAIGYLLVVVALTLLLRSIPAVRRAIPVQTMVMKRRTSLAIAIPIGAALGFLVGVTSVGSGTFFAVAFMIVFGLRGRTMVGTDILHAAMLTTAAACGQMLAHTVNFSIVGYLLIGAVPGVLVGSRLSAVTPYVFLRPALGAVLLLTGLKTIIPVH